jgi:hypothetical protein
VARPALCTLPSNNSRPSPDFQKKAKRGIATPKKEIDLIRKRLKLAEQDYKHWTATGAAS